MNRAEKIKALQQAFTTRNFKALEGTDEMKIHTVIIERDGLFQIIPIEPSFEVPDHELTLKELQDWKGCLPLFPDLHNDTRK